ncbi:redoxin domain-containing protein [Pedobacter frigiditerrae]|uniref:Redoxin domain-containing protein n=1 Tax=Pedobacter frigiditerrae TaxID=2530452 RepID=A0A4R0MRD4_9SPHI|nr:redoxin family protein [Pedobacter frigiditerrae]TCC89491.1 redoxin domain-containing protein [Pedobacter frigiditerrae]
MSLRYAFFICLLFIGLTSSAQKELVQIKPAKPEIGEKVVISFLSKNLTLKPVLTFSYSNFFEMANTMSLTQNGDHWEISFVVPRYAKYASFYIKQGDSTYRPDAKNHYELIFYKQGKPVFDTYLYKSYSLSAQIGKSDSLKIKVNQLIEKEINLYPNNYAAKLKLLANKMADDKQNAQQYLKEALILIDKKLKENPTDMGNINQVTMGYLIMGENKRIDTLKTMLLKKYPKSEVAYEYLYEDAYKTKNEAERIKKLEQLLAYTTDGESSTLSGIHQNLFEYYAKAKNEKKALQHARVVAAVQNPWLPKEIKEIASTLAENNLALDTALMYAKKSLEMIDDYPFGVIRYFPEYGYIPGYVANKPSLIQEQKGEILSIIGNIYVRQKKYALAEEKLNQSIALSKNIAVYHNFAYLYEQTNRPKLAFDAYRKILLQMPVDSSMLASFKRNYIAYNGKADGFEQQLALMQQDWEKLILPKLQAGKVNITAPIFINVYDMKGQMVDPAVLKDKVVVLDFWATWCVPCIEGFPYMQKVYNQYANNKDIVFMIMNSGSKNSLQDAITWVNNNKFTFPIYYNDRKLAEAFNVNTIPSTFIIDRAGKIQYKTVGFEGPIMEAKLALEIKDLLAQ